MIGVKRFTVEAEKINDGNNEYKSCLNTAESKNLDALNEWHKETGAVIISMTVTKIRTNYLDEWWGSKIVVCYEL